MSQPVDKSVDERLEEFSTQVEEAVGALITKAANAAAGGDALAFAQAAATLTPTLVQVAHALMHEDNGGEESPEPKEFMH